MNKNKIVITIGIVLSLLFVLPSCFPPFKYLKFEEDGKRREKLTLNAGNIDLKLKILSQGYYKGGMYEVYLETHISSDFPIEELSIRPDSILIFIGEAQLTKKHIMGGEDFFLKKDKHSYSDAFHFNCPIEQVRAALSANKSNRIKFVFNRFIMYDDAPVNFDTVYAVDTGELTQILNELYPPTSE
ncbi:MAG: hypothetical protein IID63_02790 [candidate division Zixibacteria bacterium]|nr:hypothetical protein [candidate division Zixibacteria bacterium]